MYYTYMLRCEDNSIYTGMTTDLERRLEEHQSKSDKCAKYTLTHSAINFEAAWESSTRSMASKLEYNIKKLTKQEKETLIKEPRKFKIILEEKINCKDYKRIKILKANT